MAEAGDLSGGSQPIAIVGLACRFPDADDPPALLESVLAGRRAFRRLPPCRVDLTDYYSADPAAPDATYSTRAALIEGWQFDMAAFKVAPAAYRAVDPAQWLALETAGRALAGAGYPGGAGLDPDRVGVIVGNSLGGDVSRAGALRLRWPYVQRVVADALQAGNIPAESAEQVLRHAAGRYLAPFPGVSAETLAGGSPASIASRICGYFGFRGVGHAVDGDCASSLLAVTSACAALSSGDLDLALAGGVEVSLDPLHLVGLAKTGALATGDVRIYDQNPTGYLPGEGCGMVVLMRAADAREAGLAVYAHIAGWGISAAGKRSAATDADSQLLALRRAYQRGAIDPADVQLFEGHGSGTAAEDEAELAALTQLRAGTRRPAALGSIKANIGHANAAAGAAGLIKTVLALGTGVIPPATGLGTPHQLLHDAGSSLWLPRVAQEWPAGPRIAGVSAMTPGGSHVHLVLRQEPDSGPRPESVPRVPPPVSRLRAGPAAVASFAGEGAPHATAYFLHAPDRPGLTAALARLAEVALWLSDAEMTDLACQLAREARTQGPARVAIIASRQEQLARLAGEAMTLVPLLTTGLVAMRPGIFAAEGAAGRVTLLLSDQEQLPGDASSPGDASRSGSTGGMHAEGNAGSPHGGRARGRAVAPRRGATGSAAPDPARWQPGDPWADQLPSRHPEAMFRSLAALRWLDRLGVYATAAVGHGLGGIAGLAWAGCISEADAAALAALRAEILAGSRAPSRTGGFTAPGSEPGSSMPGADSCARLQHAIAQLTLGPPRRRLISTLSGQELTSAAGITGLLQADLLRAERRAVLRGPALSPDLLAAETPHAGQALHADHELRAGEALRAGAEQASLLLETGPGRTLVAAAALVSQVPAVSLAAGPDDDRDVARVAAALFTAGALSQPELLMAGRPSRPIDIWREQIFITSPCQAVPAMTAEPAEPVPGVHAPALPVTARQGAVLAPAGPAVAGPGPGPLPGPAAGDPPPAWEGVPAAVTAAASPWPAADPTAGPVTAPAAGPVTAPAARAVTAPAAGPVAAPAAGPVAAAPGPERRAVMDPAPREPVTGIGPWVRCYAEEMRAPRQWLRPGDDGPWRIFTGTRLPFGTNVSELFRADPEAGRTLAIIGDPADTESCAAAARAARDAIRTGRLVVITHSSWLSGFWASLHAEHPLVGITVVRAPASADGLRAARQLASAQPGEYREVVIDSAGRAHEPVMVPVEVPGGSAFPLGAEDVVLVSRAAGGAALALAQVLACCGAPMALVGEPAPGEDSAVQAGLEQLRSAGASIDFEIIDVADPASMTAAVARIEGRLGPVTAVAYATAASSPTPVAELTDAALCARVAAESAGLANLLSAVRTDRLRLVATFGSVAGRYGLAGGCLPAAASGGLAEQARRLADTVAGCRALHVDWPSWSGGSLGSQPDPASPMERAGVAAIGVGDASRLLLRMLASPGLAARMAVHGRVGAPAPYAIGAAAPRAPGRGRFLEITRLHYPGIELVCEARLSPRADPYLADYQIDGTPVLPPVMAVEAMAEAASALAGRPLRRASGVQMASPVAVRARGPAAGALIRICALREQDQVTVVLQSAQNGFAVDHFRAVFGCGDAPPADPGFAPPAAGSISERSGRPAATLDGFELYSSVCFQSGRFRRLAMVTDVTAQSCRAVAEGSDDQPWFGPDGGADSELVLGSPGLADASLQLLQACVPHRTVLPAGCDVVTFSGRPAQGPVHLRAVAVAAPAAAAAPPAAGHQRPEQAEAKARLQRGRDGSARPRRGTVTAGAIPEQEAQPATAVPSATAPVLQQAGPVPAGPGGTGPDETWDIEAIDSAGQPVVIWRGVRLRDVGPLPRTAAWPVPLLTVYLERAAAALGLEPGLRVEVRGGQPAGHDQLPSLPAAVPAQGRQRAPNGAGGARTAHGKGPLAGLTMSVRTEPAQSAAACGWSAADPGQASEPGPGAPLDAARPALASLLGEPPGTITARLEAIAGCLSMAAAPAGCPVTVGTVTSDGWVVLNAAGARIACTVTRISGVTCPVAVAVMTGSPRWEPRRSGWIRLPGKTRSRRASARS